VPRHRGKKHSDSIYSPDELAEVVAWVAEADHDNDDAELKRPREAAREAEKDQEWD
jgi:hypothetical protein